MFKLIGFVKKTLLEGLGAVTDKLCYFILNVVYHYFFAFWVGCCTVRKVLYRFRIFFLGRGFGNTQLLCKESFKKAGSR